MRAMADAAADSACVAEGDGKWIQNETQPLPRAWTCSRSDLPRPYPAPEQDAGHLLFRILGRGGGLQPPGSIVTGTCAGSSSCSVNAAEGHERIGAVSKACVSRVPAAVSNLSYSIDLRPDGMKMS